MSESVPGWAIAATNPSDVEVARLKAHLRAHPTKRFHRRYPVLISAVAMVVALAIFIRPPTYGDAPAPGTVVQLSDQALYLGPSIALTGDGAITVDEAGLQGTVVSLTEGHVNAEVDPDGRFRELAVRAPGDVTVTVVGTRFSVAWDDGGRVAVERGEVRVDQRAAEPRTLRAGDSWTWDGGDAAGEVLDDRHSSTSEGAPDLPGDVDHRSGAPVPSGAAASDARAIATGDARPDATGDAPATPRPSPSAPPTVTEDPDAVAVVEAPATEAEPRDATDGAPDTIELARRFAQIGDAMDAGDPARAAALAEAFAARNRGHALSAEAGYLRVVALTEVNPKAALFAASAWLDEHAAGGRRAEVLYLHATMANDRLGDCRLAIPSYEEASRIATGDVQARSLAYLGLCALKVGDDDVAGAALQSALLHADLPRALRPRVVEAQRTLTASPR